MSHKNLKKEKQMEIKKIDIDKLTTYHNKFWLAKENIYISFFYLIFLVIIFGLVKTIPSALLSHSPKMSQTMSSFLDNPILGFFTLMQIIMILVVIMIWIFMIYSFILEIYDDSIKIQDNSYSSFMVMNIILSILFTTIPLSESKINILTFIPIMVSLYIYLLSLSVLNKITNFERKLISEYWENHVHRIDVFFNSMGIPFYFFRQSNFKIKFISFIIMFSSSLLYFVVFTVIIKKINLVNNIGEAMILMISLSLYIIFIIYLNALLKTIIRKHINLYKETDKRKHIVYLRSFEQDKYFLKNKKSLASFFRYIKGRNSLDSLMLEECWSVGSVIALGNPKDKKTPYGPSRYYAQDDEWQSYVHEILDEAKYIYMFLQETDGVKWEVKQLINMNKLKKTIFIVAPKSTVAEVERYFNLIIKPHIHEKEFFCLLDEIREGNIISFFFTDDNRLIILNGKKRTATAYLIAIRSSLRLKEGI